MHEYSRAAAIRCRSLRCASRSCRRLASAQSIAGVVRDASGAVLPGVTVEAASPALIEKVRTAVTDGSGQFRLDNLVAGTIRVTYTLPGFSHRQARRRAGADRRDGHPQRRPARRRPPGNDHRHRRNAGRGRAEQHPRAAACSSDEVVAALPASRGYGNLLAAVLRHPGQRHAEQRHQPRHDLLHVARRPQQRGHRADRRHERRLGVQRRRRGWLRLRHRRTRRKCSSRSRAGSARPTAAGRSSTSCPRPAATTSPAPTSATSPASGRRATTSTTSCGRSASPAPPRSSGAGIPASRSAARSSGTGCGSTRTARTFGEYTDIAGRFGNLNAGNPTRWDYVADPSITSRTSNSRKIVAGRVTAQLSPRNKVSAYFDYQKVCDGSSYTKDGERVPRARRRLGGGVRLRHVVAGVHDEPGRPRPHHAVLVHGAGHQQAAARSGLLAVLQQLEADRRRPARSTRSRSSRCRSRASPAACPCPTWSTTASPGWPTTTRRTTCGGRRASYVTGAHSMKGGYQAAYEVTDIFGNFADARSAVPLPRRRAQPDHAAHHAVAAGQPHALGRLLRAGPVDAQPADAAGRAALREGVELLPRGAERPAGRQPVRRAQADAGERQGRHGLQRHRAAHGPGLRRVRQRQDGHQGEPVEVPGSMPPTTACTSATNPAATFAQTATARGRWTRRATANFMPDCDLNAAAARRRVRRAGQPELLRVPGQRLGAQHGDRGQPGAAERLERAALRLAVRRVGAAAGAAARVGGVRLQPPVVGQLHVHRQPGRRAGGLRSLPVHGADRPEPATSGQQLNYLLLKPAAFGRRGQLPGAGQRLRRRPRSTGRASR